MVLFTDIVGSTAMTSASGDHIAHGVLRTHDDVVRNALRSHSGIEVKHTGDGIMASFRSVTEAARAALKIVEAVQSLRSGGDGPRLGVSVGINAGEPVAESGDLYGSVVQIAARVCDRAGEDEVLVTEVVRELLRGKGHTFEDLGPSPLKGIDDEIRLWKLVPGPRQED